MMCACLLPCSPTSDQRLPRPSEGHDIRSVMQVACVMMDHTRFTQSES